MSRRLLVLFVAIVLAVAACGGDDDDVTVDDEADDTTDQLADEADDEGDDAGDESEDESDDEGDESESEDEFGDAVGQAADAVIKVTYQTEGGGEDGQEFTIAQDPPKFALSSDSGLIIDDGEHFYTCDANDGGCFELPREGSEGMAQNLLGAFAAPFLAFQQAADADLGGYEVTGDEEIAGRDAICATIDAADIPGVEESGTATTCVDKETGILLRFEGEGVSDSGSIEAIEVSEPSDEDFEPTSEPQSLGG